MPDVDPDKILAAQQKDIDAATEANKIALDGQHQMFIMAMDELHKATKACLQEYMKSKDKDLDRDAADKLRNQLLQNAFDQVVSADKALTAKQRKIEDSTGAVMSKRMRERIVGG